MSDDRLQILRMVQAGKISPEEAVRLLEAVEQPGGRRGVRPTQVRLTLSEGERTRTLMVSAGLAAWALEVLPAAIRLDPGGAGVPHEGELLAAIQSGSVGRVLEVTEGDRRLEVWLEASRSDGR